MSQFLQLHLLTGYGPSNLNRDDTGRPKRVVLGRVPRLRISSQSLKRAWRTSEVFREILQKHLATRTRVQGDRLLEHLIEQGVNQKDAASVAREVAGLFGKVEASKDKEKPAARIAQLAFISPAEEANALRLAEEISKDSKRLAQLKNGKSVATADEVLLSNDTAADIAMFGRMLADSPKFNREAAVQVSHAFTTHPGQAEDDYYTAVDDLQADDPDADAGAGFIGVQEFGAGLFYLYICVDCELLRNNLSNDETITTASLNGLITAATQVSPKGKQASFASRSRALYVMAEKGTAQPRNLATAYLKPVRDEDVATKSIERIREHRDRMDKVYGKAADERYEMDCTEGEGVGQLTDLIDFAAQ